MSDARRSTAGFTIVEVLVAAMVLLVGMLAVVGMVAGADRASNSSRAREGATHLARDVVEQARSVPFAQLAPATLASRLQAMPGLAPGGAGWTISRRGTSYTVAATVCVLDDPKDGLGDHAGGAFCPGNPGGVDDSDAYDFKRVAATVTWSDRGRTRSVTETAVINTRGAADAPTIRSLQSTAPAVPDPTQPVILNTTTTSVTFGAVTTSTAANVIWSLQGVDQGSATASGTNSWTFNLPLAGRTDGDYSIGVRAIDALGTEGPVRELTLRLARSAPSAPAGLNGGPNMVRNNGSLVPAVELEWTPNKELNVVGYRVYRPSGSLACPGSLTAIDDQTSCVDIAPQTGTYRVVAIYKDGNNVLQEGASATIALSTTFRRTFAMMATTPQNISTNCPSGTDRGDLREVANGTNDYTYTGGNGAALRFCSVTGATSLSAGSATMRMWLRNQRANGSCSVTGEVWVNGTSRGSASGTIAAAGNGGPAGSVTLNIPVTATTVNATDRISALVSLGSSSCDKTDLLFGGTAWPSNVEVPAPVQTPNAPSGLTATSTGDGLTLSWTAASDATAATTYRIYRGGTNHTQRYDRTGDNVPSYIDPYPTGSNQYWVTAVNPNMAESSPIGPVTG